MFGKYSNQFKTIVTADRNYRYEFIHNIMRTVQPIIIEDTMEFNIPKQTVYTPFKVNVNKVINFLYIGYLSCPPLNKYHKFYLPPGSILERYIQVFQVQDNGFFKNHNGKVNKKNSALEMKTVRKIVIFLTNI